MKRYYYDLHIHSCLSPCADNDMTPYNIVNMAALNGIDIIALTDHNSCKNCPAAYSAAEKIGITLICGMELCTIEEIHVICLFSSLESAMEFDKFIELRIPDIKNNVEVFGDQLIMNNDDKIVTSYDKLLVTAANVSIQELPDLIKKFNGIAIPAHIDKNSYSILSMLGTIPNDLQMNIFEVGSQQNIDKLKSKHPILQSKTLLHSSDAHYLKDICQKSHWLNLKQNTVNQVIITLSS